MRLGLDPILNPNYIGHEYIKAYREHKKKGNYLLTNVNLTNGGHDRLASIMWGFVRIEFNSSPLKTNCGPVPIAGNYL